MAASEGAHHHATSAGPNEHMLTVVRVTRSYDGEGDEVQPGISQDLVFIIRQKKHERFVRNGSDLAMTLKVPLVDALCGYQTTIRQLDGRSIPVRVNETITPSFTKVHPALGTQQPVACDLCRAWHGHTHSVSCVCVCGELRICCKLRAACSSSRARACPARRSRGRRVTSSSPLTCSIRAISAPQPRTRSEERCHVEFKAAHAASCSPPARNPGPATPCWFLPAHMSSYALPMPATCTEPWTQARRAGPKSQIRVCVAGPGLVGRRTSDRAATFSLVLVPASVTPPLAGWAAPGP